MAIDEGPDFVRRVRATVGGLKPITQEKLAHMIGVTVSQVNRWERGVAWPPRVTHVQAMLDLLAAFSH